MLINWDLECWGSTATEKSGIYEYSNVYLCVSQWSYTGVYSVTPSPILFHHFLFLPSLFFSFRRTVPITYNADMTRNVAILKTAL